MQAERIVAPQLAEGRVDRLALYRGNLTAGWERALGEAYPVLRQLVGEEFFAGLARAYGKARPSQDPDLAAFGAHFAAFLEGFAAAAPYPYLPDVARLEWAVHRAHAAPDRTPAGSTALAGLGPEALDAARFTLHPSVALLHSSWAVAALWRAHQPGGPALPARADRPCDVLVVRRGWQVEVMEIGPAEAAALGELAQGSTFGAALEAALETQAPLDLGAMLQNWFRLGLVAAIAADASV